MIKRKILNTIVIILPVLLSQAIAEEKQSKAEELKYLYGADSTRVTPRMKNIMGQAPTATTTIYNTSNSIPLRTAYNCSAYRGQYDIDNKAIGTFYLTTENNPYLPNYKKIISSDNSECYQPCTPTNTRTSKACSSVYGSGFTGTVIYNTYSSCSAGGYLQPQEPIYVSDTCVEPPPPPPPVVVIPENPTPGTLPNNPPPTPTPTPTPTGCETVYGYYVRAGTILTQCDIWGYGSAYPSGQNYKCTVNNTWAINRQGSQIVMDYCQ